MSEEMLVGRTVLVTGASGGLGERFVRICADAGAAVVLAARRTERLDAIVEELQSAGARALAVPMDVTSEASVEAAFDKAQAELGVIDSVVANAGIEHSGRVNDIAIEDFDAVFAVNVRGVFLTARTAAKRMEAAGIAERGRIVLISSITARIVSPGMTPYSISKAAVSHMGRQLAREWVRTGPNVNCLSPGYIASDLVNDWFASEGGQRQMNGFPRRRLVEEDGLDGALLYLLSDAARNTTGSDITVDDGQTL